MLITKGFESQKQSNIRCLLVSGKPIVTINIVTNFANINIHKRFKAARALMNKELCVVTFFSGKVFL